MVEDHYRDFYRVAAMGAAFEVQLRSDVREYYTISGNDTGLSLTKDTQSDSTLPTELTIEAQNYYSIVALSARQVMGAYVLTKPPDSARTFATDHTKPWMWQKEISSNGNMNTVDVIFPAMPFFLYANSDLLSSLLTPLYAFQYSGFYPNPWSIHDLGARFPNATGHVAGDDEPMPVEESANMLIMSLAYAQFSDQSAAVAHGLYLYDIWKQWAEYLVKYTLIPESQLSTDDFAGTLHNQTNLAIKGIVALEAMNVISKVLNKTEWLADYGSIPREYITKWEMLAIEPGTEHTSLTYQLRSSWGLLYNTFPDLLLGPDIVPKNVSAMQCKWYHEVSQEFGVPLDNRHGYTKSDWEMWTAATCDAKTRAIFVNAMAHWINTTSTGLPMSDLYETTGTGGHPESPAFIEFKARPVVGGHYSLLAMVMKRKIEEAAANGSSRTFPRAKYMDLAQLGHCDS